MVPSGRATRPLRWVTNTSVNSVLSHQVDTLLLLTFTPCSAPFGYSFARKSLFCLPDKRDFFVWCVPCGMWCALRAWCRHRLWCTLRRVRNASHHLSQRSRITYHLFAKRLILWYNTKKWGVSGFDGVLTKADSLNRDLRGGIYVRKNQNHKVFL